jgi:hypothetical protein
LNPYNILLFVIAENGLTSLWKSLSNIIQHNA